MYSVFRFCLIISAICSILSCLIFEDEPFLESPSHCSNGIFDGDEQGVDCGGSCFASCPPANCNDGIQNGNETGIDCGEVCSTICYNPPTCYPSQNIITTNFGSFGFPFGGLPGYSTQDYHADGQMVVGNGTFTIYIDKDFTINKSQNLYEDNATNNQQLNETHGVVDMDIWIKKTTNDITKEYEVIGSLPFEYHPEDDTFTIYFCNTEIQTLPIYNNSTEIIYGSVTFIHK